MTHDPVKGQIASRKMDARKPRGDISNATAFPNLPDRVDDHYRGDDPARLPDHQMQIPQDLRGAVCLQLPEARHRLLHRAIRFYSMPQTVRHQQPDTAV